MTTLTQAIISAATAKFGAIVAHRKNVLLIKRSDAENGFMTIMFDDNTPVGFHHGHYDMFLLDAANSLADRSGMPIHNVELERAMDHSDLIRFNQEVETHDLKEADLAAGVMEIAKQMAEKINAGGPEAQMKFVSQQQYSFDDLVKAIYA
jgi:hypothetical protein